MIDLKIDRVANTDDSIILTITTPDEDNKKYRIERTYEDEEPIILSVISSEDERFVIEDDRKIIKINDTLDRYAHKYIYKILGEELSNEVAIVTLPQRIEDLTFHKDIVYDKLGVPKNIILQWTGLGAENKRLHHYNIYKSVCARGTGDWGEWIKAGETEKDISEITLDCPEIYGSSPKDIRFTVTAVTTPDIPINGRYSNVISYTMKYFITEHIKCNAQRYVRYDGDLFNTKTLVLDIPEGAFDEDCSIAIGKISGPRTEDYSYTYKIMSDGNIDKWIKGKIYARIPQGIRHEIRIYDENTDRWNAIPSSYDSKGEYVSFTMSIAAPINLIIEKTMEEEAEEKNFINKFTNSIVKRLPSWSKIRREPTNSVGGAFIDVFGVQIEEIEKALEYVVQQNSIADVDEDSLCHMYVDNLRELQEGDIIVVRANEEPLHQIYDLKTIDIGPIGEDKHINYENVFLVDYDKKKIFLKNKYSVPVYLELYNQDEEEPRVKRTLNTQYHHVWNMIDEIGMLLDIKRLDFESNTELKKRILDVFKNPSSSSADGLLNGIARELSLRKEMIWGNTSTDLIIKDSFIITNKIKVNEEIFDVSKVVRTLNDDIVLKASPEIPNGSTVEYIAGIELHKLNNPLDHDFNKQLYNSDNTASQLHEDYVTVINDSSPIKWGQVIMDECFWIDGYVENGILPTKTDASISGLFHDEVEIEKPTLVSLIAPDIINIPLDKETVVITELDLVALNVYPQVLNINKEIEVIIDPGIGNLFVNDDTFDIEINKDLNIIIGVE